MPEPEAPSPLILIVILTPKPGARDRFVEYESKAAAIMARYGGVIERVIGEVPAGQGVDSPMREIHVVSFPSAADFDRYRKDPDLAAIVGERAAAIEHTEVIRGRGLPAYPGHGILEM